MDTRFITAIVLIFGGAFLCLSFFALNWNFITLIYGIPILIIGIFILFNTKENYIEPIQNKKGGKNYGK